jgi:hypothetical protein
LLFCVLGGFQSAVLQQVTVQLMTNAKCQSFYAGKDKIFDHMMCAAAPGKDSCQVRKIDAWTVLCVIIHFPKLIHLSFTHNL